ncbi:MAG: UPF0280 family protein, partial [Odoribacter sp.]|nr:UPF0280 family protein [Odoribacter sp.]
MDYINRTYRDRFRKDHRVYFNAAYKETDLCIGIDKNSWHPDLPGFTLRHIRKLRIEMDRWIEKHPDYTRALVPFKAPADSPEIFRAMSAVAEKSGIGPM